MPTLAGEDRPAGVSGKDPPTFIVAVGVARQSHCAGELPDESGEGGLGSVLGDDVEIVEGLIEALQGI